MCPSRATSALAWCVCVCVCVYVCAPHRSRRGDERPPTRPPPARRRRQERPRGGEQAGPGALGSRDIRANSESEASAFCNAERRPRGGEQAGPGALVSRDIQANSEGEASAFCRAERRPRGGEQSESGPGARRRGAGVAAEPARPCSSRGLTRLMRFVRARNACENGRGRVRLFACDSRMSVCCLTRATCEKVGHESYTSGHCLGLTGQYVGQYSGQY